MTIPANAHRAIIEATERLVASPRDAQRFAVEELAAAVNRAGLEHISDVEIVPDEGRLATIKCLVPYLVPDEDRVKQQCSFNPGGFAYALLFALLVGHGPYINDDGAGRPYLKVNFGNKDKMSGGKKGTDTVPLARLLLEIDRADPKARACYVNKNPFDLRCSNLKRPNSSPVVAADPADFARFELDTELDPRSLEAAWLELIGKLASDEILFDGTLTERYDSARRIVWGVRALHEADLEESRSPLKGTT